MDKNAKEIIKCAKAFYDDVKKDKNCRYKSWEYCYRVFYDVIENNKKKDIDDLALNLAFYLASWGMYRGSTFLLQKDYKIHRGAVKIILKEKYKLLLGIKCKDLINEEKINLLFELAEKLQKYYEKIRNQVANNRKKAESESDLSQILITKILMGTLGCAPAYDKFFKKGLGAIGKKPKVFNEKSIKEICGLYEGNEINLENIRKKMKIGRIKYPQMKIIDMGLWMKGKKVKK